MTIEELKNNGWKDLNGNLWNPPIENSWVIYDFETFIDKSGWMYKYLVPGWFINLDCDEWISQVHLKNFLLNNKRDINQYAARFKYNYSEIPKCANPRCNNTVELDTGKLSRGFRKCCSLSCSSHYRWSLDGSKDRMHDSLVTAWNNNPNRRIELSNRNKEGWESMTEEQISEWKSYLSKIKKDWWSSHPEAKLKLSESNKEAWKDPEYRKYMTGILIKGNCGNYNSVKSGIQSYRSGWELQFMTELDKITEVINFISEPFPINYKWLDGSDHLYYPDFLVNTIYKSILVEIKPAFKLNNEINILKFKAGFEYSKSNNYSWLVLSELNWTEKVFNNYFRS